METLRFEPATGLQRLHRHMARLRWAADSMGFSFSNHRVGNLLQIAIGRLEEARRVRVLLAKDGSTSVSVDALPTLALPIPCRLESYPEAPTLAGEWIEQSGQRIFAGVQDTPTAETLWVDPEGRLRHGSCTSIFLRRAGVYLTPAAGVEAPWTILREHLLESGEAEEAVLVAEDLARGELYLGNSLHGLMPAALVRTDATS